MTVFDWIVNGLVFLGMAYLTFAQTLAGYFAALRKGEAVAMLPGRGDRRLPAGAQAAFLLVSAVVLVPLLILAWIPLPISISKEAAIILRIAGLGLFLAGTLGTIWARRTLGRMWGVSTMREVRLTGDHQLIQTGLYAYIRHPMYSAWFAALLGALFIYHTWCVLILLLSSILSFTMRARREEMALRERFGEEWKAYAARTKYFLPFLFLFH